MEYAIEVKHVSKAFRETLALQDVDVNFAHGRIHGIIGRNGSGKTVLFKCICGFMAVSEGEIRVAGKPVRPSVAQNIGIIIENPGFIGSMSGLRNLMMLAAIHRQVGKSEIVEVLKRVGLDPAMRKHVRKYSLGMRHRLGIAQAIMEKPDILILDEPMNGLDKQGVTEIRALLKALNEEGTTILMSSHYAEDIEALCDTVHEMEAGSIARVR